MEIGTIKQVDIEREMKGSYLDYAMSVIVARALPDARDGLKPVHRRILYAVHDMGLHHDKPHKKSARIVGEVLGKYHPHGDAAVYEAMARMAQDFSMRYMLVDGQGNFGSVDGDPPAAMRYTEARLSAIAEELLADIAKGTVDFTDNFDGTLQEPATLPAKLPNLLLNGTSGIAVAMATNIPPHNLDELCDAICFLIDHYDELDEVAVEDLMDYVKGPDFPTGALILGKDGIKNAYATGKGRVVMRAVARIEEMSLGRHRIVVTELPYQVNKASLVEKIAELVRHGRIVGISDLRDESGRQGLSIVIELKRSAQPRTVLNQLLKYTPLQSTFGVNLLALVDGEPRLLSLKRALLLYVEHRREVIARRTRYELDKASHRAHILEGLRIALANLDAVIATIRQSRTAENALNNLIRKFKLTEIQARAILDMQLRRLAALERQKIEDEHVEVIKTIAYLEDLLANPRKILYLVKADLMELKENYGDIRRTRILAEATEEFEEEDLIIDEDVLISITQLSYVKRTAARVYRRQERGGRGVTGMTTREEDAVLYLFAANTLDNILFFTSQGRVYRARAYQIPDAGLRGKGTPLVSLLPLEEGELVTAVLAVPDFEQAETSSSLTELYLTMVTQQGKIKRTALAEFASIRPSGLIAVNLDEGDELGWVKLTRGDQEVIIVTERSQAIRFNEEEVRPMGRSAGGVMAIKLARGDRVASMDVVRPQSDLLIVTTKGYGKRTPLSEYPAQGRHGRGVVTLSSRYLDQTGPISAARVVAEGDEVTCISAQGMVLRTDVESIPRMGRSTRGSKVMNLRKGDTIASIARLEAR
ncbi:MAG: DNA gyrase subunit A [Anaerolineae bacterium]